MRNDSLIRCKFCGRHIERASISCDACEKSTGNEILSKANETAQEAPDSPRDITLAEIPAQTAKLVEEARRKRRAKDIIVRILVAIAAGIILQFVVRGFF